MDVKERYEFLMIELKNSGLEDVASQVESSMHAGSGIKTWSGDEIKRFISYGYSLDWLFIGVGEMRISDKEEEIDLDKLAAEDVKEVKKSIEYKNSIHQQENERLRRELDNFKRLAFKLADVTYQKEPIHLPNH